MSSTAGIKRDDTVDETEVARFAAMAAEWWDPGGTMRMLHRLNPVRLAFIKEALCRQFGLDGRRLDVLAGLRILDIGCGAGILSEPLKRMGAEVVGGDPSTANIAAAKQHARQAGLVIDYRATTVEALAGAGELFDGVLAMEVVEHVADLSLFVAQCAQLVKQGGILVVATINRTLKSFALAIVGAEYLLRWLPRGTHRWDKLVTPEELAAAIEEGGLIVSQQTGVIYNLLADRWQLSSDMDVNYMMSAQKPSHV